MIYVCIQLYSLQEPMEVHNTVQKCSNDLQSTKKSFSEITDYVFPDLHCVNTHSNATPPKPSIVIAAVTLEGDQLIKSI